MADELTFACPRCGLCDVIGHFGPCDTCRADLIRIYNDRNRVRIASLAHMLPEEFNDWLRTPCESLGGDSPWAYIDAGFTDQVIELVKSLKRVRPEVEV